MTTQEAVKRIILDANNPVINEALLPGKRVLEGLSKLELLDIDNHKIISEFNRVYRINYDNLENPDNEKHSPLTETELITRSLKETGFNLLKTKVIQSFSEAVKNLPSEIKRSDKKSLEYAYLSAISDVLGQIGKDQYMLETIIESNASTDPLRNMKTDRITQYDDALFEIFGDFFTEAVAEKIN